MSRSKLIYILCLLPVLVAVPLHQGASTAPRMHPSPIRYDFSDAGVLSVADTSVNVISDPDSVLLPFFRKLQSLRNGAPEIVSVLHIGDSHIQAGFLTGRLRELFQGTFGNAGRGFIAPLRLAGWNEPLDYAITSTEKWTGLRCTGRDRDFLPGPGAMAIATESDVVCLNITSKEEFCMVRAFHHPQAPLLMEPEELSPGIHPTAGESDRVTNILLERPVTQLSLHACTDSLYSRHTYYGFSLENGRPGMLYHSSGVNGSAFEHYNRFPSFFGAAALLEPDLIVVSLGTNDATGGNFNPAHLSSQVNMFLASIGEACPGAPVVLTTPGESCRRRSRNNYVVNDNIAHSADVIAQAATRNGAACWDFYDIAGGKGSNARWKAKGYYSTDRLHMTREGYAAQGELFFDAFIKYYNATQEAAQTN